MGLQAQSDHERLKRLLVRNKHFGLVEIEIKYENEALLAPDKGRSS